MLVKSFKESWRQTRFCINIFIHLKAPFIRKLLCEPLPENISTMFNDVQSIVIQTQAQFYAKGVIINHSLNYSSVAYIYIHIYLYFKLFFTVVMSSKEGQGEGHASR